MGGMEALDGNNIIPLHIPTLYIYTEPWYYFWGAIYIVICFEIMAHGFILTYTFLFLQLQEVTQGL